MAASPASDRVAARSEDKGPMSPAGGGILRAMVMVLLGVVAVSAPIFLLVRFHEQPMSQVWIMSVGICSYVFFFFLLCIWRSRWYYTEFARLSYGPLLAYFSASAIGSLTAVFVLLFSMVWAAGNLGYSLAVHRLRKGTELAIQALPSPSSPIRDSVMELNSNIHIVSFVALLWTLILALVVYVTSLTHELCILMFLSYFGWIFVAAWVIAVALVPMNGVLGERMSPWQAWLLPALLPWMLVSPLIGLFLPLILSVLCHLLLMLALVAFLWYNLAIYMHFLETATPSTTAQGNEDTLETEIQQDKFGEVKPDPALGETTTEICSYSTAV